MKPLRFIASIAILALVAGCSSGSAIPVTPRQMASMTFRIVMPSQASIQSANRRSPQYISVATQSVIFALTSWNGTAQSPAITTTVALTPSGNCTGTPLVCTVASTAPVGSDTFAVETFNSASPTYGTTVPLSWNTINQSVVAGSNTISVTLNGVVATVAFSPTSASCVATSACTTSVVLNSEDMAGDIIIGPGSYAYDGTGGASLNTIALSCKSGLTPETSAGGTASASMAVPADNNLAKIVYDGTSGTAGGSLTCSASYGAMPVNVVTFTLNFT